MITKKEIIAVGDILLSACSSEKGMLKPWKPFDIATVAKQCIEAYLTASKKEQILPEPVCLITAARALEGMADHPTWTPQPMSVNSAILCAKAWGLEFTEPDEYKDVRTLKPGLHYLPYKIPDNDYLLRCEECGCAAKFHKPGCSKEHKKL